METYVTDDISDTLWIDVFQCQVKVRKQALHELMLWCDKIEVELQNEYASINENDGSKEMIYIYRNINHVVQSYSSVFTNEEFIYSNIQNLI